MSAAGLDALKLGSVLCVALSLTIGVMGALSSRDTALHRAYFRYLTSLERRLRLMFIAVPAFHIVLAQAAGMLVAVALTVGMGKPLPLLLVPAVALAPGFILERMRRERVSRIEQKLDGFVVALANALRASPSAGRALAMIHPVTPAPLDQEIALVLREMRVGSTLEQALGNLSARVRSFQLDAAMSGLLIGRQTGGNVPEILDGAALTLREIARLQGVLRSKTAEGRAQANVLAVFPFVLIFAFDLTSPGYFRPLTESWAGVLVMVIAITMWVSSVLMTRRIMAVEL
ncbi:MAG: type II secretion system F family protein [Polyangiales bacterium]